MQNMIFGVIFSKCVDLVPNLTHFEIFFQSEYFFKVRCNKGEQKISNFFGKPRVFSNALIRPRQIIAIVQFVMATVDTRLDKKPKTFVGMFTF